MHGREERRMNINIQEEMITLRQLMEATRIAVAQQTTEGPMTSTTRPVEARLVVSHALEVMGEPEQLSWHQG
jgi:hypothetical protein